MSLFSVQLRSENAGLRTEQAKSHLPCATDAITAHSAIAYFCDKDTSFSDCPQRRSAHFVGRRLHFCSRSPIFRPLFSLLRLYTVNSYPLYMNSYFSCSQMISVADLSVTGHVDARGF